MALDWELIHRQAIRILAKKLRPVQYRELFSEVLDDCPAGDMEDYSQHTDLAEKFRQRYGEHYHPEILLLRGGMLALRRWFPGSDGRESQPAMFAPDPLEIHGNCLVSYEAGYEHAKREQYLVDHYKDGGTQERYERRRVAYLFESHVKNYYLKTWPAYYLPPTNEKKYEQSADNDFRLKLPGLGTYKIDTKTPSFEREGQDRYKVRHLYKGVIYIAGFWDAAREVAVVSGIRTGKWLADVAGYENGDFFRDGDLVSFEVLSVMLNMAKCGMRN